MEDLVTKTGSETPENIPEVKSLSFFQRVIGIIVSPSETMKNLIAKPRILFPILAMALSMLALMIVTMPMLQEFTRQAVENQLAKAGQSATSEQLDAFARIGIISGMVSAPVATIAMWLAGAAILLGVIKIFKGEGSFKQFLSITGYAYVISMLYLILVTVLTLATGTYYAQSPVTSLATLLPSDMKGTFAYGFLSKIELFSIWQFIVITIGVTQVSKLSKNKVYSIMAVLFILLALGTAVLTSFGSKFAQ